MDAKMLEYGLIEEKYCLEFYVENKERKQCFIELLKKGFPYAIEMYFRAPAKFVENSTEFENKYFREVSEFYKMIKRDSEGKKIKTDTLKNQYKKSYRAKIMLITELMKKSQTEKDAILWLEENLYRLSTPDILRAYRLFHENERESTNGESKKENSDIRLEFHEKCLEKIKKYNERLDQGKNEADRYFLEIDKGNIEEVLFSREYNREYAEKVKRNLGKNRELLNLEYFKGVLKEYKDIRYLELYLEVYFKQGNEIEIKNILVEISRDRAIARIGKKFISDGVEKLSRDEKEDLFSSISNRKAFEVFLEAIILREMDEALVENLLEIYLRKFSTSGYVIGFVAEFIEKNDLLNNQMIGLVENYAKRWLLDFNFHGNEEEIVDVIEALAGTGRINDLLQDFSFWKEMEKCNAFIKVIDNIALSIGFEECFGVIKKNYIVSRVYGISSLAAKWLQAATSIAISNEEAQKLYVLFVGELIDERSSLDYLSKKLLTKEIIDYLLAQASEGKKRLEMERKNSERIRKEGIEDTIQKICKPLEKLETMISICSEGTKENNDGMMMIKNALGKVRDGLEKVDILPVEGSGIWIYQKAIPYDMNKHECTEDIESGELVTCLSMGMMNREGTYCYKAKVKKHIGEKKDGNNI